MGKCARSKNGSDYYYMFLLFFFFNSKPREQSEDFEKANKKRSTPNIILITKVASFFFSRPAVPGISVPCCFFDHQKITIEDTDKTK